MHPDNIIEMKRKCPRCVLGDINNSEYRYRTGRNLPTHNHDEVYCNCGGHYGHEAPEELGSEASLKRIVVSTESYRGTQRELPPSLPRPKKPEEPDWSKIGWEYFENLNVDKVIWDRWTPPMRSRYLALRYLGCDIDAAKLGEMNEEKLDRLDEEIRKISYTLKHKAELDQRKQERAERAQQKARLAIRGTSGGVKVLGGTALIAGSIAAVAGTVATGGILPLVVLAGASAGVMFGTSDVIEGVGDLTSGITGQGLDQRSYNPIRDGLFGGNEFLYTGTVVAVSLGTSATATRVLSGTAEGLPTPNVANKVESVNIVEETAKISGTEVEIRPYYPSNNGALLGKTRKIFLMPGDKIDRFGKLRGRYFSPVGTPMEMRALPYDADLSKYRVFKVIKPFEVEEATIAPAFGEIGLGKQFCSPVSAKVLLERGIIIIDK